MQRPELTFSPEVSDWVRETYHASDVILEYGSGGSTVLASEMSGKTIFSVENDKEWADQLRSYLDQANGASKVHLHHVFTGKVGKWGRPVGTEGHRYYHDYPLGIWGHPDFKAPDCVLIDGRFREACFYAVMLSCTKKTVVLFDDYTDRVRYHRVEHFFQPVEVRGRMAKFVLDETALPRKDMARIIGAFANPF